MARLKHDRFIMSVSRDLGCGGPEPRARRAKTEMEIAT